MTTRPTNAFGVFPEPGTVIAGELRRVPFVDLRAQYRSIREEIDEAVLKVLESGQFVAGEWVERFEEEFSRSVGACYAVGVGSGTAALELALRVANVRPGDEVIVPANSFFATAEAVSNVGAIPIFADVDASTLHLDVSSVRSVISAKTRAIVPVHLYGRAMDLEALQALANSRELVIIEDAAQAYGTNIRGVPIGASGRLTCFSFYPGKNLGAYGDAGAVTSNDSIQAERLRLLRNHGSPRKYEHSIVGTNSRLDAIQAAILSVKLRHISAWNAKRVCHAKTYAKVLEGSLIRIPEIPVNGEHNFHLFVVRSNERNALMDFLRHRGIETGIHYPVPLHLTEAYQALGFPGKGTLPVAELLATEILSLPMYPELGDDELDYVRTALCEFSDAGDKRKKMVRAF